MRPLTDDEIRAMLDEIFKTYPFLLGYKDADCRCCFDVDVMEESYSEPALEVEWNRASRLLFLLGWDY